MVQSHGNLLSLTSSTHLFSSFLFARSVIVLSLQLLSFIHSFNITDPASLTPQTSIKMVRILSFATILARKSSLPLPP